MSRFEACLKFILRPDIEGGFVNHPDDPGGMTNLGVTKKTWEAWVGRGVTEAEMRGLKPADVAPLYEQRYWQASRADKLPPGLDLVVFDTAVNCGPVRAVKLLQECLGVVVDGVNGPITQAAAAKSNVPYVIKEFTLRRRSYYRSLSKFPVFGKGWLRRAEAAEEEALGTVYA